MADHPASDLQVLVVGEALVDIVERDGKIIEHVGGSPANVALGLGRSGLPVGLLTQLADDARGRAIAEHLAASGVDVLPESIVAAATSTARALIGADGQAEYEFDITWNSFPHPHGLAPRVLHTGSIAAFLAPGAESVRQLLSRTTAEEITFDPNIRPALLGPHAAVFEDYEATARLASVVKMSDQDAAWLYPGATIDQVADRVLELGPRLVAITCGADGAIIAAPDHRVRIPAVRIDVVDTIGAGDTFMSSLVRSVVAHGSAGLGIPDLLRIGSSAVRAAAITVSRAGADLPWRAEL